MPETQQRERSRGSSRRRSQDTTIGPIFHVRDLTGGVDLRPSATNIQPNRARRLVNGLIRSPGELGIYPGFESFTTSLGARRAQGGQRIYLAASTFTLVADNGSVYKPTDAGVWGSAVLTGLHATNPVDFPYDRDIVAAFDASTVPKKSTDGTTWTQLGITQPAAPTLALVAGGSLVNGNTYEVSYAYQNTALNHISNAKNTAQIAVTTDRTIRVTVVASTDAQVDKIKIYVRDVTSGETLRRLSATIDNTSGTHDITVNNWDAQDEAPLDHDVAVAMAFGVHWKNRWWGRDATVGNRLRFTQIFQNQTWPSTFFVDIPFERGEDIRLLVPLGDVLVVFGSTRFYLILGQTSLDFEVRPALGGQAGAFGFRAGAVLENGVAHAASSGLYLFNGATDELLTDAISPAWDQMVDTSTAAELERLPMVYHQLPKELRVAVSDLYPTGGDGEWILDLSRTKIGEREETPTGPAWFATTRSVGGYISWDGDEAVTGSHGRLFSWGMTAAKLTEERVGTDADGADITMEYDGFALPFEFQSTRVVDTFLEHSAASGTVTVDLRMDGRLIGTQSFNLGGALSRYGTALYDVDRYGGGVSRSVLPITWPLSAEGYTVQFLLKYVGQGDARFFSYGHNAFGEDLPRGIRGL